MHLSECRWLYCGALTALFTVLVLVSGEIEEKSHASSVSGMVELIQIETTLIKNLNEYANELREKLRIVQRGLAELRSENDKAANEQEKYLSNPLNAFKLIRRMQRDWIYWQLYMEQPVGNTQIDFLKQQQDLLPTSTDLVDAAEAIHRIQTTYDIPVEHISSGLLNGKQYNVSLDGLDTYAIGVYQMESNNYGYACQWMNQSVLWFEKNMILPFMNLDLYQVKVFHMEALVKMDRILDALNVLESMLKVNRRDIKLLRRKAEIEALLITEPNLKPKPFVKPAVTNYERGCRGLLKKVSNLHCLYNTTNSAFLRLAPLKMELVSLEPYMVIYHDVISAAEIKEMQDMAIPNLKRATTYNQQEKRNKVSKLRTSKVAWFPDSYNNFTHRINQRLADMTRFDLYGSEMLQIMNYGLGGHYDKHFDYFNVPMDADLVRVNGDRIATVLFYLNDVEQGGATVFPNIPIVAFPKEGSAIMWYNLNDDGTGNTKTLHAACPVVVGSKWVCNKWIRERQQLFRRPCFKQSVYEPYTI